MSQRRPSSCLGLLLLCSPWFSGVFWIRIYLIWIRIQHFRLNTVSDPGFWWPKFIKFTGENKKIWSKITIYLSLGLHKGRPSYRRTLQLSKENIQHFKTLNFLLFIFFWGPFLPFWIRIRISKLQKKLSALKREHPTIQNMKFLKFFIFLWFFLPSCFRIRIPDPLSWFNPDPGSETLGVQTAHPPAWWRASRWGSDSWRWRWRPADRCMTPWRRGWSGHVTGSIGSPGSPQLPSGIK